MHAGAEREVNCEHLQSVDDEFIAETLGMAGEQEGGSDGRSTHVKDGVFVQLGRQDGRRGKDGCCGRHVEGNGEAGCIIAALLEEMKDLMEKASFESCETELQYLRCIRQ